ncbi:MAG: L-type lectin-domain containing protein, partial [Bacteroidota bacterium]
MKSSALLVLLLSLSLNVIWGQTATIEEFSIDGDTRQTEQECFRLTEQEDYSSGSIWYKRPIDLTQPFALELRIMLGCKDNDGADGMVFMFADSPNRTGWRGEGIGFAGLVPSLGIELDTYQNYHLHDPYEDHVAVMVNGRIGHFSEFSAAQIIENIEDCQQHRFSIYWDPSTQNLSVEIRNEEVLNVTIDLQNDVFGGRQVVYFGVSAATGRKTNVHEVCFDRMSWVPT